MKVSTSLGTGPTMQLWTGLVHLQCLAVEIRAVESDDCLCCFSIGLHLNESESSG